VAEKTKTAAAEARERINPALKNAVNEFLLGKFLAVAVDCNSFDEGLH